MLAARTYRGGFPMARLAMFLQSFLARPLRNERGGTAAEYALVAFLVAAVIVVAVAALGAKVLSLFTAAAGI